MVGIDESRPFLPVNIAILTISDSRTLETDKSGQILVERLQAAGHQLLERRLVPDERETIVAVLWEWVKHPQVDVVITTGGTGITGRDVTPEALAEVCEKEIPGFGELFRRISYETIGVSALQSRATAGVAQGTYLFALPGSSGACRDGWDEILRWQLDSRYRPCNLVSLMPRLLEA
ncbi:molybdenum cofactor biosynthesis protein B [Phormidium yuhuli AB48]|uniref:Molybdenum cofactor biosynthesis protein B n=1 Tax=Phormidium yuhuli AB48 TaxID=2940671 RepID=A0ABY5ARL2_9CYAN|nr:molybdenum cofactor biosynthesis protein B [Phormidium yuhuli]USR91860.1 molybdenum cofactor biosynthesis protein B [Phormidium yuhuli AB48]